MVVSWNNRVTASKSAILLSFKIKKIKKRLIASTGNISKVVLFYITFWKKLGDLNKDVIINVLC